MSNFKFIFIFLLVFILSIAYHSKPICTNLGCNSFSSGWITLRTPWVSYSSNESIYPRFRDLNFREQYINAEVGFDLLIALTNTTITTLIFFGINQKLKKSRFKGLLNIIIVLSIWYFLTRLLSIPYQMNYYNFHYPETKMGPVFKPIFGPIIDFF